MKGAAADENPALLATSEHFNLYRKFRNTRSWGIIIAHIFLYHMRYIHFPTIQSAMAPNNASPNKNMAQGAMPASARPNNAANNIKPAPSLQGVWRKDFQNSDMEALTKAVEAMKLRGIQVRFLCARSHAGFLFKISPQ